MAEKTIHAWGRIRKGDFVGGTIWRADYDLFYVMPIECDRRDNNIIYPKETVKEKYTCGGWLSDFRKVDALQNFFKESKQYEISTSVIEKIVDVSSYKTGPDPSAFIDGVVTGGVSLGVAKAMASSNGRRSLAVYTKDGKKMLIEFFNDSLAAEFEQLLFIL